jgi:epoxyqueuosine reductase
MKVNLQEVALTHGFSTAGFCSPRLSSDTKSKVKVWLEHYKGPQMDYLVRRLPERLEPQIYFKAAQSALVFADYYFRGWAKGSAKVSNYAWGNDYHLVLKEKLTAVVRSLKETLGEFEYRICVDTAPVLEKALAVQSGIGWQGKNSLVLNSEVGSQFFIGVILTSLAPELFAPSRPIKDRCGTCTRCIEACPTAALQPYVLNASKCISYWTLEHKGPFDSSTPDFSNWVAGCDICQEVCPWNQKLIPISSEASDFQSLSPKDIESSNWPDRVKKSALSYIPEENWKRNLEKLARHVS